MVLVLYLKTMIRGRILDLVSIAIVSISVIAPQLYLAENPRVSLTATVFAVAVLLPIALASVLFLGLKKKVIWYTFMAYIWAVTEDAPVYIDSIFTWPEVTSGFQHFFLEILFHVLTFCFMLLALRESIVSRKYAPGKYNWTFLTASLILFLAAFLSSYAQNLPLGLNGISGAAWYRLDADEHVLSIGLFYSSILAARRARQ